MTTRLEIQYHTCAEGEAKSGDISIELGSEERAANFQAKCPVARISATKTSKVYLQYPPGLKSVRSGTSKRTALVFRFSTIEAAEFWWKQSLIGDLDREYLEVRFESYWDTLDLDGKLGMKQNAGIAAGVQILKLAGVGAAIPSGVAPIYTCLVS